MELDPRLLELRSTLISQARIIRIVSIPLPHVGAIIAAFQTRYIRIRKIDCPRGCVGAAASGMQNAHKGPRPIDVFRRRKGASDLAMVLRAACLLNALQAFSGPDIGRDHVAVPAAFAAPVVSACLMLIQHDPVERMIFWGIGRVAAASDYTHLSSDRRSVDKRVRRVVTA